MTCVVAHVLATISATGAASSANCLELGGTVLPNFRSPTPFPCWCVPIRGFVSSQGASVNL
jgi:hypothetical protein